MQNPTIGRIVIYRLTADEAATINRRRTTPAEIADKIVDERWSIGAQAHIGNPAAAGHCYPAMVVATWPENRVNLQVFLDGNDVYWAPSRDQGDELGQWQWPARS